jgi:branched-chain amino acid transport system ATP-binding protein
MAGLSAGLPPPTDAGADTRRPGSGPDVLRLERLSKWFGGLQAVAGIDLGVGAGERLAIIGPNGAGKTTLFGLISGELRADRGRVVLLGQDVSGMPSYHRALLGLGRTYQLTNLFPGLSVLDNILLALLAHARARAMPLRPLRTYRHLSESAVQILDLLGLSHVGAARVADLSYGEQREVEIALALAARPHVLLLDEPTAGLSPAETWRMMEIIRGLPGAMTILLIEHDMSVAFSICSRVVVMHQGAIIAEGTPEAIRRHAQVREVYLGMKG